MLSESYRPVERIDLKEFPRALMPTEEERREVNSFFIPYLFFKNSYTGREIWAGCCRRYAHIQYETPGAYEALTSSHKMMARCPFCGRVGELRATRYLRSRVSLEEYAPVVFLREVDGGLLALAAWTGKDYRNDLLEEPRYHITGVYRFEMGKATMYQGYWGKNKASNAEVESGSIVPSKRKVREPFTDGSGCMFSYQPYHVIGLDAIGRSIFRYCQYEKWNEKHGRASLHYDLMKYLAACCIWPRDMEMLVKFGVDELVNGLVCGRSRHARLFRWGEEDPRRAFGLDGQELRSFLASDKRMETLEIYKELKKRGGRYSFSLAEKIRIDLREGYGGVRKEFMAMTKERGVDPGRALRYLEKSMPECGAVHGGRISDVFTMWKDYLDAAEALGYNMSDGAVLMPRELMRKHDEAAEELSQRTRLAAESGDVALLERLNRTLARRIKKYDFRLGAYLIRVALSTDEVTAEGQALKHCVGGYASRHMEGKTTILFLRKVTAPDVPLATIEMDGNRLRQIHGYRNDAGKKPASKTYKELLDVWLDWLQRGSPRAEDGTPKLRKKKGDKAA